MTRMAKEQGGLTQINNDDFHTCMFTCFLSQEEPKRVHQALKDPSWIEAMQEELLQFKMQKEEGIDYAEVFAPVARIEAIRGKIYQTLFIKIVWYSTHHVALKKSWLVQKQTAIGKDESNPFIVDVDEEDGIEVSAVDLKLLLSGNFNAVSLKLLLFGLTIDAANLLLLGHKIFAELTRMGYEKPSTKLTFYKAFFSAQWVGKGFSGVDIPLFAGMLVPQQAQDVEAAVEDEYVVNEVFDEPTSLSPTPATLPPPPQQEHIPSPP
nr:putative ribonuclease H-like domain-containing protein [Tanacetum cinerariifolium]